MRNCLKYYFVEDDAGDMETPQHGNDSTRKRIKNMRKRTKNIGKSLENISLKQSGNGSKILGNRTKKRKLSKSDF